MSHRYAWHDPFLYWLICVTMSHVTHLNESVKKGVMSRISMRHVTHIMRQVTHATHKNDQWVRKRVTSHIPTSLKWVMSHIFKRHVTLKNEFCLTMRKGCVRVLCCHQVTSVTYFYYELQRTATHCNTLIYWSLLWFHRVMSYSVTYFCYELQRTATHCNTLIYWSLLWFHRVVSYSFIYFCYELQHTLQHTHFLQYTHLLSSTLIHRVTSYARTSAEYSLFHRALLQKRPIILRSLLIVATPYEQVTPHISTHIWSGYN